MDIFFFFWLFIYLETAVHLTARVICKNLQRISKDGRAAAAFRLRIVAIEIHLPLILLLNRVKIGLVLHDDVLYQLQIHFDWFRVHPRLINCWDQSPFSWFISKFVWFFTLFLMNCSHVSLFFFDFDSFILVFHYRFGLFIVKFVTLP